MAETSTYRHHISSIIRYIFIIVDSRIFYHFLILSAIKIKSIDLKSIALALILSIVGVQFNSFCDCSFLDKPRPNRVLGIRANLISRVCGGSTKCSIL